MITSDKTSEIVIYGASKRSMDAITAVDKLKRSGYVNIHILKGGLAAWRVAGLPVEGEEIHSHDDPGSMLILEDGKYKIDTDQSVVEWFGRNPNTRHHGTVNILRGDVAITNGRLSGMVEIDMRSIKNINLEGDPLQSVLVSHLISDDFFFVRHFPVARFNIWKGDRRKKPYLSSPNYQVFGTLELKGIRAELEFISTVTSTPEGGVIAEAHFDIDRTRWNVIYGSTRYFEHLGMHLVFDLITFNLKIVGQLRGS